MKKYSTEGTRVNAWFSGNTLNRLEIILYGETSKVEVEYVFKSLRDYLVSSVVYYYSSPIYMKNSEMVATRKTEFLVCNGSVKGIVQQDMIQNDVDNALEMLGDILRHPGFPAIDKKR